MSVILSGFRGLDNGRKLRDQVRGGFAFGLESFEILLVQLESRFQDSDEAGEAGQFGQGFRA